MVSRAVSGVFLSQWPRMIEHMFEEHESIPSGLDEMAPGPKLGALLWVIDPDRLSGHDRVIYLRAAQRQACQAQARVLAGMSSVADHMATEEFTDDPALAHEAASTEIRAALRLTRRGADSQLEVAVGLRRRLPRVWRALRDGDIDVPRARVLLSTTSHLDENTARALVDEIIGEAHRYTTGQLRERVARLCVEADPDAAAERYEQAVDERRVTVEASPDGTATLIGVDLPPDRVAVASSRIDRLAKQLNRTGDSRSIDQLRADVFLDILAGKHRDTKGGVVDIHVDLETLAQLADAPGDLAGYGPVVADIARQVTDAQVDGEWRFTITDPATGLPVHDGTTRRRPTTAQRRTVEARDQSCVFPGCRMPAHQCDLDHRTPWSIRRITSSDGLAPGCRHDHITNRHRGGWTQDPPAAARRRSPVDQPARPPIHDQRAQASLTQPAESSDAVPTRSMPPSEPLLAAHSR